MDTALICVQLSENALRRGANVFWFFNVCSNFKGTMQNIFEFWRKQDDMSRDFENEKSANIFINISQKFKIFAKYYDIQCYFVDGGKL